jgi:hypothetical protein
MLIRHAQGSAGGQKPGKEEDQQPGDGSPE